MKQYRFDDVDALQELVSPDFGAWSAEVEITQDLIDRFAELSGDDYWIHTDPERCKTQSPFGGTIAHGFLTLSLLPRMMEDIGAGMEGAVMGLNYGFDRIRFLAPVKVNSRVRARTRLQDVQQKSPGQFLIKQEVTVEIENESKPALIAEWLTMVVVG